MIIISLLFLHLQIRNLGVANIRRRADGRGNSSRGNAVGTQLVAEQPGAEVAPLPHEAPELLGLALSLEDVDLGHDRLRDEVGSKRDLMQYISITAPL